MQATRWSQPDQLRAKLERQWQTQQLLKGWLADTLSFPLRLPISGPSARELREAFVEVQSWSDRWQQATLESPADIDYEAINNRRVGRQSLPRYLVLEDAPALFDWIGQGEAYRRFAALTQTLTRRWPPTREVIGQWPFRLLELESRLAQLIAVLSWFESHPQPDCYLRELEIGAVDSKFIEQNRQLIHDLLLAILPASHFDATITLLKRHGFERKFGLKYDPPLIRFRLLDPALALGGLTDLTVPLAQFQQLRLPIRRVFITENKVNGLAFPESRAALVIFGLGYGIELLGQVDWLKSTTVYYWGDIDTHGFNILGQLRKILPATRSLLMDEATLLACRALWVKEPQQQPEFDLSRFTPAEASVLQGLWQQRWRENLRLEQERIPYRQLERGLAELAQLAMDGDGNKMRVEPE